VNYRMLRAPAAEFVGTALFVLVGAGSAIANQGGAAGLAIALAHGVGLAVVVTIMLPISGGHINPAVSFALWLGKQIDGWTLGSSPRAAARRDRGRAAHQATFRFRRAHVVVGTPQVSGSMSFLSAAALEALFTFFLVSAVYGTCVSAQKSVSRDSRSVWPCWSARWAVVVHSPAP